MRATTRIDALRDVIRFAVRGTSPKTGLVVHSALHLEVADGVLAATGTDGQTTTKARMAVEWAEDGKIVVPAAGLNTWLGTLDGESQVSLEASEGRLDCRTDTGHSCRLLAVGLTFPETPWPEIRPYPTDLAAMGAAMRRVLHATGGGEGMMANLFVRANGRQLSVTATDSYRLARADSVRGDGTYDAVVSREIADLVVAVGDSEGEILYDGGHVIGFSSKTRDRTVLSRVIAGKFPTADHLLDGDYNHTLTVSREALAAALQRVRPFAGVREVVVLDLVEDHLRVSGSSDQVGEASETVPLIGSAGETGIGLHLGLGARYLSEAVTGAGGEQIILKASASEAPLVVTSDDGGFRELVMPVKL